MPSTPTLFIPRRAGSLALAIQLSVTGLAWAGATTLPALWSAPAQARTTDAARVRVDIPAGPLSEALNRFTERAGVYLSGDSSLTAGKRSPGLSGEFTVREGLDALLQGTDLGYRVEADDTITLVKAGGNVLAPVNVHDVALTPMTEGSGGYTANAISTFKGTQSVRRTPQPVTVVTRQSLDDRALLDMHDVLSATPGVTVDYTDSERVNYYSRGYRIESLQIDGGRVEQGGSIFIQPDMATLDRVEILRGSAGLLKGTGNPSATVNMVRKKPTEAFQASAKATYGSWERQRIEGDISGALIPSGRLRGRLVAVSDDREFFQDARQEDRKVFYGVLEMDLTDRTTLATGYQYTHLDATGSWGGLPADFDGSQLDLPRDTYLGADWNQWNRFNEQLFLELDHYFDNGWHLEASATKTRFRMEDEGFKQTYFEPASTTNPYLMNVSTSIYDGDASDQRFYSVTADGPFRLFGREHELVVGADHQRVRTRGTAGIWTPNVLTNVDIRDWDPYHDIPEPYANVTTSGRVDYTRQHGVYGTARFSVTDPLTVITGARATWWEFEVPSDPDSDYDVDKELTPYFGLVYDLNGTYSVYASYTDIFQPQNEYNAGGSLLDPIVGKDYEAGLKGEFRDGRLNVTLAAFRINNEGAAVEDAGSPDPCTPYYTNGHCRVADGETQSEGWELEIAGEVLPGWQLLAGYTNNRTEYVEDDDPDNIGDPIRTADPRHLFRLFTSYNLNQRPQGLTVGGGVRAQSDIYTTGAGDVKYRQAGYAVYDLMASYDFGNGVRLRLNANNILDKEYYKKVGSGVNNYYGDPRNYMASVEVRY